MKRFFLVSIFILVTGCTTAVTPVATGGSRADGIVEMSYEYGAYMTPDVDRRTAMRSAKKRCETWGYDDAEAFEGLRSCSQPAMGGCNMWRVTTEYQCIHTNGQSASALSAPSQPAQNFRDEIRQIQESMACNDGARIVSSTAESVRWELNCGDGESLEVRCFDDDCYLR